MLLSWLVYYIVTVDISIMPIGYKYKSQKFLGFISAKGDGSYDPGGPYLSSFPGIILMYIFSVLLILI